MDYLLVQITEFLIRRSYSRPEWDMEYIRADEQENSPANPDPPKKQSQLPKGRRGQKSGNPLHRGIIEFLTTHLTEEFHTAHKLSLEDLTYCLPKRFSVYPPLLLLPTNAFSATPPWRTLISALDDDQRQALYACTASFFSSQGVTHVAINAPIVRTTASGTENRMRTPTGLVPLYGDFGPLLSSETQSDEVQQQQTTPTEEDFREALWVRAVQNLSIVQVWAPLYSMFSRGNVTEKARILGLGTERFDGLDEEQLKQPLRDIAVVDMYAGIGYFVFSYLKRGVGRVWAWEINAWSVEGLRRGCEENGWGIRVVPVDSRGRVHGGIRELVAKLGEKDRVVAFLGDNTFAGDVLGEVKIELESRLEWEPIRHVNLGLLPTSKQSWEGAVRVLDPRTDGWVHVHENVDTDEVDEMKCHISRGLSSLLRSWRGTPLDESLSGTVACVRVERVKTYAPGVLHCVFDMRISPTLSTEESETNES